ncbi:MAG TPA: hypothetical protein VFY89_09505 [Ktedonobacterales bacterium]
MEANRFMGVLGNVAKHILHALRRAFIAISVTGLSVAVIAAVATEAVAAFLTQTFPTGATHLAAAAMAVAFGYAAAMTVAIVEILKGLVEAIELIVKEAEKLGGEVIHEVEKFGGEAIHDVGRLGRAAVGGVEHGVGDVIGGVEHGVGALTHHHGHDANTQ